MSSTLSPSTPARAVTKVVKDASSLRDQGKCTDALALLQLAVELEPDCAEYHYQLGRTCLEMEKLDEAATALARAVDLLATHLAARYWLGVAYVRLQEWDEAEEHLALVTRQDPLFPGAHFYLGLAREELGKLDLAEQSYRQVAALDPSDVRTHFFLGCLAAGRSQMEKARAELASLRTLDPSMALELEECLRFCDAVDKLAPFAAISFVEKTVADGITTEVLEAADSRTACEFLKAREVRPAGYCVRVITPSEGVWCRDGDGIYLEKLIPLQGQLRAVRTTGTIVGAPSPVHFAAAAAGTRDNYVVDIRCGHCGHVFLAAIRYQKSTLVRCPACTTTLKIQP